jgi:aminopeptidase I
MTKNVPGLRKAASNVDLYSDPSPPSSRPLRHGYSTLSRAHTTASPSHRPQIIGHELRAREVVDELRSRHSIAAPYANLIDVDEDYGVPVRQQQNPPPVPPKIPEAEQQVKFEEVKTRRAAKMEAEEKKRPGNEAVDRMSNAINRLEDAKRYFDQLALKAPPQPCAVYARSKEGPDKYTKPFTDFMTSASLQTA